MQKKLFLLILLAPLLFKSQEGLRPLGSNMGYIYHDLKKAPSQQPVKKNAGSLQLPFKDDFYYAYNQTYPDQSLWMDSATYVNTGHAIAPLSTGVATFDGLNKHGWPYTPNLQNMLQSLSADTLRSQPINLYTAGSQTLQPGDSVALTFYYQARGNGDAPEASDSLIVDFYKPNQQSWSKVWYSKGNTNSNTNDTVFKRAFIWINDTAFLFDNFQFRIRNKATTAGDFDHWHVDYVYLDKGRSMLADTTYDDIAFGYVPTPFLSKYSSMPWQQYNDNEKAGKNSVFIRNNSTNSSLTTNMTYEYLMYDNNSVLTHSYTGGANPNLLPFKYSGWSNLPAHANPAFSYTFSTFTDSADFSVKHYIFRSGSSTDFFPGNDTVVQRIKFGNYFAFDDGSAEAGYYINGTGGKMAQRITLNVADTLRGIRIYFDPAGNMSINQNTLGVAQSSYKFRIILWGDNNGIPSFLLLRDSLQNVKYYNDAGFNLIPEYKLTTPLVLSPGSYYIGIQQYVASGITVGFDKNIDHHQSLFFDSGNGWNQSSIYGSLMLRPVFGKTIPPPVGIREFEGKGANLATIYPSPANETISIQLLENEKAEYRIINTLGQTIEKGNIPGITHTVNSGNYYDGVYFIEISSKGLVQRKKIIVQH